MQKGFIFDINKCAGCGACRLACAIENNVDPQISWRRVYTFNQLNYPSLPQFYHSLACNHCVDPPCVEHCPANACAKDPGTGAVTIDSNSCIGCGYCSWVCPYDAPQFNHTTGVMEKCTFCQHRLEDGLEPACAALCPTNALQIGEYEESGATDPVLGLTASKAIPAIRFVPLREGQAQPVCSAAPSEAVYEEVGGDAGPEEEPKITLRSEWPLAAFTLLFAVLAAWIAAVSFTGALLDRFVFLGIEAVVMILGTLHLGTRTRAYRSILGWRSSWLSREIILVLTFLFMAAAGAWYALSSGPFLWLATLVGLAALFTIDRVYDLAGAGGLRLHSARVILVALYLFGIFSGNSVVFGGMLAIRSFLYWRRKSNLAKKKEEARPVLSLARIVLGFFVPVALWTGVPGLPPVVVVIGVLAGELIDRNEFYVELDFPTPSKQMARDLVEELRRRNDMIGVS